MHPTGPSLQKANRTPLYLLALLLVLLTAVVYWQVQRGMTSLSKRVRSPKALHVQMDITKRCDLRCIMCVRKQSRGGGHDMPVKTFEVMARKLFDMAAVLCLSCGAEPLMYMEQIIDTTAHFLHDRLADRD